MSRVGPGTKRSSVTTTPQGLEIVIPTRKNYFVILFLGSWLIGWALGEVVVPLTLIRGNADRVAVIFSIAWLIAWTIGGVFAIFIWLWNVAGKERITINDMTLTVRRELFGRGIEMEYRMPRISNLRVGRPPVSRFGFSGVLQFWGFGGGLIAFDYGASTYRFGSGVEEAEARQLLETIRERYQL